MSRIYYLLSMTFTLIVLASPLKASPLVPHGLIAAPASDVQQVRGGRGGHRGAAVSHRGAAVGHRGAVAVGHREAVAWVAMEPLLSVGDTTAAFGTVPAGATGTVAGGPMVSDHAGV